MRRFVFSLLFMLVFLSGIAQNKKVQVSVAIDWQEVGNQYPGSVNLIESLLQDTIVSCMKNRFPFFDFTDNADNYKLEIKITDPQQGNVNTSRHSIVFEIELKGSPIRSNSEMVTLPINQFGRNFIFPGDKDSFVRSMTGFFIVGQNQYNDLIVQNLLSHIPITNDAFFLKGPETWVIPTSFTNNKIARESHLLIELYPSDQVYGIKRVESVVNSAICNIQDAKDKHHIPETYPYGCLIGTPLSSPNVFSDTIYKRKSVYITKYKLFKIAGLVFNNTECDAYNQ